MGTLLQKPPQPQDADAFAAHCRRVAAWSVELARAQGASEKEQASLERAALRHHSVLNTLEGEARVRFLADLGIQEVGAAPPPESFNLEILEIANALDDHFEWEPFAESGAEANPAAMVAFSMLSSIKASDLEHAVTRLPVFPTAAQRALDLLMSDDWNAHDLELAALGDQVLASDLIRAANSWVFGPRQEIKTLSHAVTYIGAEHAAQVLFAATLKPFFAPPALRAIWNHSLEASDAARHLARVSRRVDRQQALLAGLVHDIGRLAMTLLPDEFLKRSKRLLEKGCELLLVERALTGLSHAEFGARILAKWNFPPNLVDAVRFHHQPEQSDSVMAALLYLVERWTNPSEDLPSLARSEVALGRLGLTAETLDFRDMTGASALKSLSFH